MLLCVDIGNSNITLGVFEGETLRFVARLATDRLKTGDQYAVELRNIFHIYDISTKESFNAVERIANKVAKEYGSDGIDESAKIKDYVKNTALVKERIDVNEVAQKVFDKSPTAREEFLVKTQKAMVPETFSMNQYITKKINKNMRIVSDNGIEISFPAEYYNDGDNIVISENEDGSISIRINNLRQIENK